MYKFPSRPVLPKLVKLTNDDDLEPNEALYLLDWKPKEKQMKIDFDIWVNNSIPKHKDKYRKTELFPVEYLDWLYKLRFLIPRNYIREIAYQAKHGQEEWSREFPENYSHGMDTAVREHCLISAEAHFETVFYLLSDCLYDTEKRKKDWELGFFAKVAMLIYFWDDQTGTGLLLNDRHSGGYDRLDEIYLHSNRRTKPSPSTIEFIRDFKRLITERELENRKNAYVDIG